MNEGDKLKLCSEKFDAIVIGSGMGGLCTASILSKAGKKFWSWSNTILPAGLPIRSKGKVMNGMWGSII